MAALASPLPKETHRQRHKAKEQLGRTLDKTGASAQFFYCDTNAILAPLQRD